MVTAKKETFVSVRGASVTDERCHLTFFRLFSHLQVYLPMKIANQTLKHFLSYISYFSTLLEEKQFPRAMASLWKSTCACMLCV